MNKHLKPVLLLLATLLILSCSKQVTNVRQDGNLVIYPAPPDSTRIQYLTTINNSHDIAGKQSAFNRFVLGVSKPLPVIKPYGIAIRKGKIHVCDASLAGLEVMDLEQKSFEYFIPKGRGQLKMPINCVVDDAGQLYVADPNRRQIVIFDSTGLYLDAFGEAAEAKPTDVVVFGDKIWVTDALHNKVNVYQKDSKKWLFSFPDSLESGDAHLYQPTNLCITPEKIYVTDFGDFKVKSYTHKGEFIAAVGGYGNSLGQLSRPKGIAVDRDDNLFVVDAGFENVQIFNSAGQLLMFFGGSYKGPGDLWLPAKVIIDYDNLSYFQKYLDPAFKLKYLIFVTNQYGPDKVNVYGAVEAKK